MRWVSSSVAMVTVAVYLLLTSWPSAVDGEITPSFVPLRSTFDLVWQGEFFSFRSDPFINLLAGLLLAIAFLLAMPSSRVIGAVVAVVVVAEIIQLLAGQKRSTDVDDVIWSAIGAILVVSLATTRSKSCERRRPDS